MDSAISPASPKSAENQETKNKKRRRSTGNNNPVNKRRNSVPDPLTTTEENPNKMTDTPVEMFSATNTMLNEIKKNGGETKCPNYDKQGQGIIRNRGKTEQQH